MITSATEPQPFFRPGTVARTSDWPVLRAPSPSGVFEVSPTPGGRVPRGCAFAPGDGQLWNPQAAQSARLVEAPPRFVPHFVHTSSSWLNLVERWFGELTPKRVRRDSFRSLEDLEQAIREFLATWNIGIAYTSVTHFRFSRRFERGTKMPEQHTILGGKVHVYKRPNSSLWQCSSYFAGKNRRTSTHEESLSKAKEIAEDWYLQLRGKLRAGEIKSERPSARFLNIIYASTTSSPRDNATNATWTASTGDRAFTWSHSSGTLAYIRDHGREDPRISSLQAPGGAC